MGEWTRSIGRGGMTRGRSRARVRARARACGGRARVRVRLTHGHKFLDHFDHLRDDGDARGRAGYRRAMSKRLQQVKKMTASAEFANVQLGDPRLHARLAAVAEAMAKSPEASFAAMSHNEAEREGMCRFVRNPRVEAQGLLEPHFEKTAERAKSARQVLVVHDSTEMALSEHADVQSYLAPKRKGFVAHLSLVLDATQERCPLGVIGLETIEREAVSKLKRGGRAMTGNETTKLKNREFERWGRGVTKSAEALAQVEQLVHVIDAEGDSYELLSAMQQSEQSFVVRLSHDRRARNTKADAEFSHIRALLAEAKEFKRTREVHVSKRRARRAPQAAKARPSRNARQAQLKFSFIPIVIKRPSYLKSVPEELQLNVVRVLEQSPPAEVAPIEWILLTNLPVGSKAQAERIVDIYRQRWLAEEFFKALKTGCAFRKRQLTNRHSIYNTLALLLPIAWRALWLRQAARDDAVLARTVLTPTELKVLHAKAKKERTPLPSQPTAADALNFLAQIGGHRKSNGPPGWETLMRGLQRFEDLVQGWRLAEK